MSNIHNWPIKTAHICSYLVRVFFLSSYSLLHRNIIYWKWWIFLELSHLDLWEAISKVFCIISKSRICRKYSNVFKKNECLLYFNKWLVEFDDWIKARKPWILKNRMKDKIKWSSDFMWYFSLFFYSERCKINQWFVLSIQTVYQKKQSLFLLQMLIPLEWSSIGMEQQHQRALT